MEAFYRISLPRAPSTRNGQLVDIDPEGVYRDELFEEAQRMNDAEQGVLRSVLAQQRIKKRFSAGAIFGLSLMLLVSMLLPMLLVHSSMSRVRARVSSLPVFTKANTSRRFTGVLRQEAAVDIEWTPWDGAFNNIAHPEYGVVEGRITRPCLPRYADGAYAPSNPEGPNPRTVSELVMGGDTGYGSLTNKTAFLVFFGQQVVEEILDGQAFQPAEPYVNIPVPQCDPLYDPDCKGDLFIPLPRNRYDLSTGNAPGVPRAQLNEISAWIDGTLFYGPFKAWADTLRAYDEERPGRFACLVDEESGVENCNLPALNTIGLPIVNPPPPTLRDVRPAERFFRLGNPRTNENPMLLAFAVMWFRYHNVVADRIHAKHPDYDDEEVFLFARQWLIAIYQKIVFYDWLPSFLGIPREEFDEKYAYKGYRTVDPAISQEFQVAAMRFGHTLVTPGAYRREPYSCTPSSFEALRTCNSYFRGEEVLLEDDGPTKMLLGLASQLAEREDATITPDLRGFVFGVSLDATRRDLMAINIQRAREHGVGTYNQVRKCFRLPEVSSFDEISSLTDNPAFNNCTDAQGNTGVNCMQIAIEGLKLAYDNDISKCDLWPCGLLEVNVTGPGPLFQAILIDQFLRIRDGDRFWFENDNGPIANILSAEQIDEIWNTTIRDVMVDALELSDDVILQSNPFKYDPSVCAQPVQLSEFNLENCSAPSTYNWYRGHIPQREPSVTTTTSQRSVCEADSLAKILFGSKDGHEHDDRLQQELSTEEQAAAAGCPVYKARTKLARIMIMQQVMMERVKKGISQRYVSYLGSNDCGITNGDSLVQLAWTIAGIVMWLTANVIVMYFLVRWIKQRKGLRQFGRKAPKNGPFIPPDFKPTRSGTGVHMYKHNSKTTGYGCLIYHSFRHESSDVKGATVKLCEPEQAHFFLVGVGDSVQDGDARGIAREGDGHESRIDRSRATDSARPMEVREVLSGDITMISPSNVSEVRIFDKYLMVVCKIGSARLFEFDSPTKARLVLRELQESLSRTIGNGIEVNAASVNELAEGCTSRAERMEEIEQFFEEVKLDFKKKYSASATHTSFAAAATALSKWDMTGDTLLGDDMKLVHETVQKVTAYNLSGVAWTIHQNETDEAGAELGNGIAAKQSATRTTTQASASHRNTSKRPLGRSLSKLALRKTKGSLAAGSTQTSHGLWRGAGVRPEDVEDTVLFTKHEVAAVLHIHPSSFILSRMFYEGMGKRSSVITARQFRRAVENLLKAGESPGLFLAGLAVGEGQSIDKRLLLDIVYELKGGTGMDDVDLDRGDAQVMAKYMNATSSATLSVEEFGNMIVEMQEKTMKQRNVGWQQYLRQIKQDAEESANERTAPTGRKFEKLRSWQHSFVDYCKAHRFEIFWGVAYGLTIALIFLYTWWYYYSLREVYGLRGILTVGLCVTRASASVDMFVYSITLLPMCRNLITFLRSTKLHRYVPFDRAYEFHVVTAVTGEFFTALHVVGHCVNFYNITTQRSGDLTGYFRAVNWNSDFVPSFAFWVFETITGMTGFLLTFVIITLMVFAIRQVRAASFQLFWVMHHVCFMLLYTMIVLHGSFVLVQRPIFHYFLLGPLLLFILDKLYSFARESERLQIIEMRLLPKGVTALYVRVSPSFSYSSGQWARLKIPALGTSELHPITISSAPHDPYVSFHILACGPWTQALRDLAFEMQGKPVSSLPTIRIDGPYGEGHQDWMLYETVLLVGSGIGCTPFVSVLKDILHQVRSKTFRTTKVVAVFISRGIRDLAWITNELSQLEPYAPPGFLELLFFDTEQKVDKKTSTLDARHLAFDQAILRHVEYVSQILAGRSSLIRVRGFVLQGRPNFDTLLKDVQADCMAHGALSAETYSELQVGVFACASAPVTLSLKKACIKRDRDTMREIASRQAELGKKEFESREVSSADQDASQDGRGLNGEAAQGGNRTPERDTSSSSRLTATLREENVLSESLRESKMPSVDMNKIKNFATSFKPSARQRARVERPVFFTFYGQVFSSDTSFDFWSKWKTKLGKRKQQQAVQEAFEALPKVAAHAMGGDDAVGASQV
ncbi:Dual oxidase [Porphyridium purpureum]|uniref:Dual oxidase n=1 Tax=Porphyridium purpureum TaxID=35688 RepID=A0A5J4YIM2_PORPP|nr:Dual oxidase [Porphyridium purpureum]|eukprot:POR4509..scf243_20